MEKEETHWAALLERVRRGDSVADRELVALLFPRVASHIRTWKARRETVEDLAQEVFLRVFQRLGQYQGGSFTAWVDVITRHVCYDALRKQRLRPEWSFTALGDDLPPEQAIEVEPVDIDAAEIIAHLLAKLPPEQAWLIREVELAERTIGEVSRSMGWTAVGGRLRLFRARLALKRTYDEWNASNE